MQVRLSVRACVHNLSLPSLLETKVRQALDILEQLTSIMISTANILAFLAIALRGVLCGLRPNLSRPSLFILVQQEARHDQTRS